MMMRQRVVDCERAPDTAAIAGTPRPPRPHTTVAVLDPALRIVRVDLPQLDLGQDNARQPREQLLDVLAGQGGDLHRDGDVRLGRPVQRLLRVDLAAVRGLGGRPAGAGGGTTAGEALGGADRSSGGIERRRRKGNG